MPHSTPPAIIPTGPPKAIATPPAVVNIPPTFFSTSFSFPSCTPDSKILQPPFIRSL